MLYELVRFVSIAGRFPADQLLKHAAHLPLLSHLRIGRSVGQKSLPAEPGARVEYMPTFAVKPFCRFNLVLLTLLAIAFAPTAHAASSDPLNAISQQNEKRLEELDQQNKITQTGEPVLTAPVSRADLPAPGGPSVLLKSVTFEPESAFLSREELDAITDKYMGKKLDFSRIANLVRDVNDLYEEKGVVTAAAVLPPQTLSGGHLKVQLVEGRLGSVVVVGEHQTKESYIFDRVQLTTHGDVVDVPTAAKDITWYNKTNRSQLRLLLQPGASFGLTDLALGISEPQATQLQYFLDNEGVHSTGEVQWGGSFSAYGLAGMDDSLLFYATASEGSLSGTISYDVPVTASGTRVAGSLTASSIRVVYGPTAPLDITGGSQAATITVSQPLVADTNWTVKALTSASFGLSNSKSGNTFLVDTDTTKGVFGFSLGYANDNASFTLQPQLIYAHVHDRLADTFNNITIANGTARGVINLANDVTLSLSGAGQWSPTALLPGGLLFQIGGPGTVRGYPSDGIAGDSGYYAQLEVHKGLSEIYEGLDIFAFADLGEVFSTFPARTTLLSAGAGVSLNWNDKVTGEVTLGIPLARTVVDQADFAVYGRLTVKAF